MGVITSSPIPEEQEDKVKSAPIPEGQEDANPYVDLAGLKLELDQRTNLRIKELELRIKELELRIKELELNNRSS